MSVAGTPSSPLRVAIIGSGPAAFYAAEQLLKQGGGGVQVDMLERLPTPYGLVRGGVAPDHQKIKSVIRIYEQIAKLPGFRFYGNLEFGRHVSLEDLSRHFHQIVFATGAQTDRRLGVPGEDLAGIHSATEFVAWYNGHPDFRDRSFDLSVERAAIVGVGNVAIDVARILLLPHPEREITDMAPYAIEALAASRVREVSMMGRRGCAQAAFTNLEIKELGHRIDGDVVVTPEDVELDPLSLAEVEAGGRIAKDKFDILKAYAAAAPSGKPGRLRVRFLTSPLEFLADERGHVRAMRVERNELVPDPEGGVGCRGTGRIAEEPVGLVFRSVGYRGVPLPGMPFDPRRGVIPNDHGRVLDDGVPRRGIYVTGWIKRGPNGVIGTNKADSIDTVKQMVEDAAQGVRLEPERPTPQAFESFARAQEARLVSFEDLLALDKIEMERGAALSRPRVKFTTVEDMLSALAD
jgi:ferredoxin--NADP+ reductase